MAITPVTVEYRPPTVSPRRVVTPEVAIKATWSGAWQVQKHLYVDQLVWQAAPGESSAHLSYRYGRGRRQGESKFGDVLRLDKPRYYVRVSITRQDLVTSLSNALVAGPVGGVLGSFLSWGSLGAKLSWYGILEINGDRFDGTLGSQTGLGFRAGLASGRQSLMCYGLERLLDMHTVRTSTWLDPDGRTERLAGRGLTFNPESHLRTTKHQRSKNRCLKKQDKCFLFTGSADPDQADYWSTHDIVEYLLAKQSPRDGDGAVRIKFRLAPRADEVLPTWDRPELKADHVRLRQLLNSLMPRERLMSYYLDPELNALGVETGTILVHPFTFANERVTIGNSQSISLRPNPIQKIVVLDRDPGTADAVLKKSTLDQVEQAVARGARRRICFTASYVDQNIGAGWSNTLQTAYRTGASAAGDYPASSELNLRSIRNSEARAADKYETVFARFVLPSTWDGKAGNGVGGTKKPVTPDDSDVTKVVPLWPPELFLLRTLPLLKGHTYDGAVTAGSIPTFAEGPFEELTPLVLVPLPEALTRYVQIENMGRTFDSETAVTDDTDHAWSASVRVPHNDRGVLIRVHGDDQHVLAGADWSPIDASDVPTVAFDWKKFLFTVAIEDDRHAEARFPERLQTNYQFVEGAPIAAGSSVDAVRTIVIDVGDACRLDYVVPNTVVRVESTTGALVRCDGGYIRDDRETLARIARLAYEWYRWPRAALEFSTSDIRGSLFLGDLVTKIGQQQISGGQQQDVNSVVTQITLTMPGSSGGAVPPAPRIHYVTAFGELDPLKF